MTQSTESIVLGGGCFWCVEAVFNRVKGVVSVLPGYAGGFTDNPNYEGVCRGQTGHAEVVRVEFDPKIVSLEKILEVFFASHDPTTKDQQGNDQGPQYRSIILCSDKKQENQASKYIKKISKNFPGPIITEVAILKKFFKAESYHEKYFEKNALQPYCKMVIAPKIAKARKTLPDFFKNE